MPANVQVYVHCVWSTWNRLPLITPENEARLHAMMFTKCRAHNCKLLAIGSVPDHVHVLLRLTSTITIARLIGELKGASSHLATHVINPDAFFKWQRSYGAFSISKDSVDQVHAYVIAQKEHHRYHNLIPELEPINDLDDEHQLSE